MKLYPDSSYEFKDSAILNKYLYGGNAVISLEAPDGKKHTYKYSKPKNADSFPDDVRFVYALHNGVKEWYIGMIELNRFRLTKHSRFLNDTDIVRGAKYIENLRHNQDFMDKSPMKIYHLGTCSRCGRELKDIKSRERGFGPKCYKKLRGETI